MKKLASLLLLLHCTAVTVSRSCRNEGDVEIIGTVNDTFIAGRMEVCFGGLKRAVYDDSFEFIEAQLVCRDKGFNNTGVCRRSCFGASELRRGFTGFLTCTERTSRLILCGRVSPDGHFPNINAGVICYKGDTLQFPLPGSIDSFPANFTTTGPTSTPALPQTTDQPTQNSSDTLASSTLATISIALVAALLAIFLLTLVGVVMAWVFFCLHMKGKNQDMKRGNIPEPYEIPLNSPSTQRGPFTATSYDAPTIPPSTQGGPTSNDAPLVPPSTQRGPTSNDAPLVPPSTQRGPTSYDAPPIPPSTQEETTTYDVPRTPAVKQRGTAEHAYNVLTQPSYDYITTRP